MGTDPHDRLTDLLHADGRALRRLAQGLLAPADVDDVLQDAAVAALATPAGRPRELGGWLRGAVRNLAALRHRTEARRRARELAAARGPRPPAETCGPAAIAAHAETIAIVAAAVRALAEPYRSAIVLRFWHGHSAEEIARQLGLPHNTVRSRLQRGLDQLRRHLDGHCGGRERWSAPLLALARPEATIATAGTTVAVVGVLMQAKWILGAAALLLAALALPLALSSHGGEHAPDPLDGARRAATGAAVAENAPADTRVAVPDRATGSGPTRAPAADAVVVRGRCVDEAGRPLAACGVDARARLPLALLATRELATETTDATGRFELRFVPEAGACTVTFDAVGRVPMRRDFVELAAGAAHDLGDVVLATGGGVSGRVVDERGRPVPEVTVALYLRRAGAPETLQPETSRALATGADGTFELAGALAGGEWHAFVHGFETAESGRGRATFRVEAGAVTTGVELVTTALLARLRGIVVDARGAPIAGASVQHADAAFGTVATCGDDGAFALARFAPDAHESVTLRASAPGFEPRRVGPVAWGGDALRIELAPNAATWLEVVRDDDGSPVERYALHVTQAPGSSDGMVAQIASPTLPRAAGRAALAGLPRGPYLAWIEPEIAADVDPERAPLAAFLAEFAVDGDPTHAVLRAPAAGTRRVRVVDAAAAPVAGTRLELVLPVGEDAVTVRTRTELPLALAGAGALRVAEVTSDAAGEAELAGATGAVYALRVLGPGHRPVVVPAVTLGDELEPLIVQVAAGAAVVGNVTPVAALDELGPSASDRQMAAQLGARGESILADSRPQIVLRPLGGGALLPERASDGAVAVDGSYRIDGVPPGTWQVCLGTRIRGPGGASMSRLIVPLATVRDLGPGEERRADLDASKLRPGELRALVLVDGEPLRSGAVALLYRREGQHFGSQPIGETALPLRTDGDGHLVASLPPGDWAIEATVPGRNGGTAKLRNEQVAAVAPAATTECTFVLQRRTLQVRILCADGSPAKERRFSIMQEHYWAAAGTTDADGRLALESPPTGAFELVTWPPELAEQSAQTAYIKQHPYPQWLDVLVRIGPVQIPSGHSEATVELRLPH